MNIWKVTNYEYLHIVRHAVLTDEETLEKLKQADKVFAEGKKYATKKSLFVKASLRAEQGAVCLKRAGQMYKLALAFPQAAESFALAAECCMRLNDLSEAADLYKQAGFTVSRSDPLASIPHYQLAAQVFTQNGKRNLAGQIEETMGDIFQKEAMKLLEQGADASTPINQAETHYDNALNMLGWDVGRSHSKSVVSNYALMLVTAEKLDKAAELLETAGSQLSVDESGLARSGGADFLLAASMLRFSLPEINSPAAWTNLMEVYGDLDGLWHQTGQAYIPMHLEVAWQSLSEAEALIREYTPFPTPPILVRQCLQVALRYLQEMSRDRAELPDLGEDDLLC